MSDPSRLPPFVPSAVAAHPDQTTLAFVKGAKRKRLSKACDACHKSKRRCDGTAPCSNCYFASKTCTYTDSSGRPVPAPRNSVHERSDFPPPELDTRKGDLSPPAVPDGSPPLERNNAPKRRNRADMPDPCPNAPPSLDGVEVSPPQSKLLDPDTTFELVNLFFAHCSPHRLIFHKPSFSAALSRNRLPEHLVLAVCAVAAPLSREVSKHASLGRVAGVPFYEEAVARMFDTAGRLLCPPTLATAQALCLLEMHAIAANHSWTKHFKYFDLALRLLEESLAVDKPDEDVRRTTPASPTSVSDPLDFYIERECIRRCFWLIQCMGWITAIYTYRPIRPRSVELMATVRLPIDETTFDLAVHWNSATVEFLHEPAPRTRYASQFGHVCRILSIYQHVQAAVAMKEGPARIAALRDCRTRLEEWNVSLTGYLRFSEENVEKQTDMIETGSNAGAWCFCFMHALYPCCYLALLEGEGGLGEPIPWVRKQLGAIFKATGTRAKNTILSACVLWSYSKYHPDDQELHSWDRDFEKVWGFRVTVVAHQWRQAQAKERAEAAAKDAQSSSPAQPQMHPQQRSPHAPQGGSPGNMPAVQAKGVATQAGDVALASHLHGDTGADHRFEGTQPQKNKGHKQPGLPAAALAPNGAEPVVHVQAPLLRDGPALNLPSLKSSGLLEWNTVKPTADAFANSLSISGPQGSLQDERRMVSTLLNSSVPPGGGNLIPSANMPVGLDWLGNST